MSELAKLDGEAWKDIEGWNDRYKVSNMGRVKSDKKILAQSSNSCGYPYVGLYNNGISGISKVHRLVAKAFLPNKENKPCVHHIDHDKKNNAVSNLAWCTYSENMRHEIAGGRYLFKYGEDSNASKFSNTIIEFIIYSARHDGLRACDIVKILKLSGVDMARSMIQHIMNGKFWKHIDREQAVARFMQI